jgi:hypothetical protein
MKIHLGDFLLFFAENPTIAVPAAIIRIEAPIVKRLNSF